MRTPGPVPATGQVLPGDAAVVSHVILNGLAVTVGRASTLRQHWDRVPAEVRDEWLRQMGETAVETSAVFQLLVRGHDPVPADPG